MNDNTGEIRKMTPEEAAALNRVTAIDEGRWHDVSDLTENERLRLQGLNRKDRRAYFAKQRKSQ